LKFQPFINFECNKYVKNKCWREVKTISIKPIKCKLFSILTISTKMIPKMDSKTSKKYGISKNSFCLTICEINSLNQCFSIGESWLKPVFYTITQCAKDCGPRKCIPNCTQTPNCIQTPKILFDIVCALFFSKFLHYNNQVCQWNM